MLNIPAYLFKNNKKNWKRIGNISYVDHDTFAAIVALTSTRIATINWAYSQLVVYDFDGTRWSAVGTPFTISGYNPAIAKITSNRIAFFASNYLRTYQFDGTTWSQVGSALYISSQYSDPTGTLCTLDTNKVIFTSNATTVVYTYYFNGSAWSTTSGCVSVSGFQAVNSVSPTRIIMLRGNNLEMYDLSGGAWVKKGNGLNLVSTNVGCVCNLYDNVIAFADREINQLRAYKFDGTNFIQLGRGLPINPSPYFPWLTSLDTSLKRIMYMDSNAYVYDFKE